MCHVFFILYIYDWEKKHQHHQQHQLQKCSKEKDQPAQGWSLQRFTAMTCYDWSGYILHTLPVFPLATPADSTLSGATLFANWLR